MQLSDFLYELNPDLIAREPLPERSASRLLCVDLFHQKIRHTNFSNIVSFLKPNDLLICNNTKVIPARLFGKKSTGGQVEVFLERILNRHQMLAHIRASKSPKENSFIFLSDNLSLKVEGRQDDLFILSCDEKNSVLDIIETFGEVPLPPYLSRSPDEKDKERYQTIFAKYKGSVAAPTAGLHFDEKIMKEIQEKQIQIDYVTLHVGAGTFSPVRVDDIKNHRMHSEYVEVSESLCKKIKETKEKGGNIIAVGTTTVRSLETACLSGKLKPFSGETSIFIYPGFQFKCVDALITNLHLPGSTLLMLVAAFGGHALIMQAYKEAVEKKYRFFSYGDAMFIDKR